MAREQRNCVVLAVENGEKNRGKLVTPQLLTWAQGRELLRRKAAQDDDYVMTSITTIHQIAGYHTIYSYELVHLSEAFMFDSYDKEEELDRVYDKLLKSL